MNEVEERAIYEIYDAVVCNCLVCIMYKCWISLLSRIVRTLRMTTKEKKRKEQPNNTLAYMHVLYPPPPLCHRFSMSESFSSMWKKKKRSFCLFLYCFWSKKNVPTPRPAPKLMSINYVIILQLVAIETKSFKTHSLAI